MPIYYFFKSSFHFFLVSGEKRTFPLVAPVDDRLPGEGRRGGEEVGEAGEGEEGSRAGRVGEFELRLGALELLLPVKVGRDGEEEEEERGFEKGERRVPGEKE